MLSLKQIYADSPEQIKNRVPVFNGILIFLFVLSLLVVGSDISSGADVSETVQHFVLVLVTAAAWILTRRGYFKLVSDVYFVLIELAMLVLRLRDGYYGPETFGLFAAILGSFLVFGAVFIDSKVVLFSLCGLFVASFTGFVAWVGITGAATEGLSIVEVAYPGIAVLATTIGLVGTRVIFDRNIAGTLKTLERVQKMSERTRQTAIESSRQTDKADVLLDNATSTAHAAEEIEASMQNIEERIRGLDERIEHSGTTMRNMKSSTDRLKTLSSEQTGRTDATGEALQRMVTTVAEVSQIISDRAEGVQTLTERAGEGRDTVERTISAFRGVTSSMGDISNTATVIEDIAERTNLLAMNAAIQAAHAGDAGKGFAVVAGEIRSLAESSSRSARSIAEILSGLYESVKQADSAVQSADTAFSEIAEEIRRFSAGMNEIAGHTEELHSGSVEITRSTGQLKTISSDVDEQVNEVNVSHNSFNDDISSVSDISKEIAGSVGEMVSGIGLIKIATDEIRHSALNLQEGFQNLNLSLKNREEQED